MNLPIKKELTRESSAALTLALQLPPFPPGSLVLLDGKGIETQSHLENLTTNSIARLKLSNKLVIPLISSIFPLLGRYMRLSYFKTRSLKPPVFPSQTFTPKPPPLVADSADTLAKFLSHKYLRKKIIYLILLAGDSNEDACWIPQLDLSK